MHFPHWKQIIDEMRGQGIEFDAGLRSSEFTEIESRYGFQFPSDLGSFVSIALPHGPEFPDWRGNGEALRRQIEGPLDGLLFDLQNNALWRPAWGIRPAAQATADARLRELVAAAPRLIPLFGHRYLPATPPTAGNVVLSVYQSDIIRYERNLAHWLNVEFSLGMAFPPEEECAAAPLPFWDDLIDG